MTEIDRIIERIVERYEVPIRIGSRCEANVFYRVEDLATDELELLADHLATRIVNVCQPTLPEVIVHLTASYTNLPQLLARELAPPGEELEIISIERLNSGNGVGRRLKNANVILVNEIITTARSCLEAHTKITMMGASVLCWTAIVDRTFGPGPVPVVANCTGEPVRLLEDLP